MRNVFNSVRKPKVKYSNFNLTHERVFTAPMGALVPILCQEVVAGDTFKNETELLIRFSPLVAPIMHQIDVYTHFFFVPNRLIYDEWEDFITGGEDGNEDLYPPMYAINYGDAKQVNFFTSGNLADYLGVPAPSGSVPDSANLVISALPFRAYFQIYNDYYRDQNLEDEIAFPKTGGPDIPNSVGSETWSDLVNLKTRAWRKDYFSSSLPFAQRGNDVKVPIDVDIDFKPGYNPVIVRSDGSHFTGQPGNVLRRVIPMDDGTIHAMYGNHGDENTDQKQTPAALDVSNNLRAQSANLTIRTLRRLFAVQRFEENNATSGSRYIEQLLSRFGVISDDARLQRSEYLGGGKQPVVVTETVQTSQTTTGENGSPQGTQTGQAISAGRTHTFKKRFKEHGWVLGIMSIVPKPIYMQGLPRQFSRMTRYDYLTPEFAGIGEQEVKTSELYFSTPEINKKTFGYQGRYNEYRYCPSSVHGAFRDSLSFWHLARKFDNEPRLNEQFVHMSSENFNRIFAVEGREQVRVQLVNHLYARRALPKYPYND